MKRIVAAVALALVIAVGWMATRRSSPPEVPFARAIRQTLTSSIPTNGKVEPLESAVVRSEIAGTVTALLVQEGQAVKRGTVIAELDAHDARADLEGAEARIAEARAQLETLERGGRSAELAEVESGLDSARQTLRVAQQDYAIEQRLAEHKAATGQAVTQAHDQVERAQLQIDALERRRKALVSSADRTAAEARIHQAEPAAALARHRLELSQIRAPIDGVVYQLRTDSATSPTEVRTGVYLQPGDSVARMGQLDRMRVRVYVDEPELGRVAAGLPVLITWAARAGQQWKGQVSRVPTEVVPLGTRQVGEVTVLIDNPGHELLPGTNIDAEIIAKVVANALSIPKEALRRENDEDAVYALAADNTVQLRKVKLGAISIARAEVVSGLKEGDAVALPVERLLKPGDRVAPVFP